MPTDAQIHIEDLREQRKKLQDTIFEQKMQLDNLIRFMIGEGLVKVDDMPNSEATKEAIVVMMGMQNKIAEQEARIASLLKANVEVGKLNARFFDKQVEYDGLLWEMQNNPKFGLSEYGQERVASALREKGRE